MVVAAGFDDASSRTLARLGSNRELELGLAAEDKPSAAKPVDRLRNSYAWRT